MNKLFWENRNVVVTGANGFIGSHLVRSLTYAGARVYGFVRSCNGNWRLAEIQNELEIIAVDITDHEKVKSQYKEIKPSVTFHTAAYGVQHKDQDIITAIMVNIKGGVLLISAVADMPGHCFINVGTRYESLRYDRPIKEDDPHCPIGIYGSTKYAAHILMSDIAKRYGVNYRTAVLFGVYGPMENINKFIPYVITSLLKGNPPQLTGCEQIRNYTYIDDIVGALLRLAEIDRDGLLTINIGSQTPMSLKEIVERIAQYIGSTINNIEFGSIPYRSDEIWKLVPDTHLCQDILRWSAETSIYEGISRTIEWYKGNIHNL